MIANSTNIFVCTIIGNIGEKAIKRMIDKKIKGYSAVLCRIGYTRVIKCLNSVKQSPNIKKAINDLKKRMDQMRTKIAQAVVREVTLGTSQDDALKKHVKNWVGEFNLRIIYYPTG